MNKENQGFKKWLETKGFAKIKEMTTKEELKAEMESKYL